LCPEIPASAPFGSTAHAYRFDDPPAGGRSRRHISIRPIDCFEFIAKEKDLDPMFNAEVTTAQMVAKFWKMLKRGLLRLIGVGDDDDAGLIQQTVTPAKRAHARVIGAKPA
jgi:hypothetical protein